MLHKAQVVEPFSGVFTQSNTFHKKVLATARIGRTLMVLAATTYFALLQPVYFGYG
jgi:hypothetical protein